MIKLHHGLYSLVVLLTIGMANPGLAQRAPSPVVLATAKQMPLGQSVQLPGTVIASRTARLSSSIGGLVNKMHLDFGDTVNSGDRVVELDNVQATYELAQAQAAVQEARASLNEKQRLLDVGRNLTRRGAITKNQADARRAEVRIAQAVLKKLRAVEAAAGNQLQRHRIVAPFSGVIAQKMIEAGEWVSPGTPIVELVANRGFMIDVSLPQTYYAQLTEKTTYAVSFDATPGQLFSAERAALSPVSDPTMRTFKLRVRLRPDAGAPPPAIAPGMSAQVILGLQRSKQSVVIPRDAVERQADGRTTVWIATPIPGEKGLATVTEKTVRVGRSFSANIVVLTGLKGQEQVVVSGNESLRPGQKVRFKKEPVSAGKGTAQ